MKGKLLLALLFFLVIGSGASQLRVTDDASEAMLPQDQSWQAGYSKFLDDFPGDQTVSIVLNNVICSSEGWTLFIELHDALDKSELTTRVLSLASSEAKLLITTPTEISVDSVRNNSFSSASERCRSLSNYEPFQNRLVKNNGESTFILAFTESRGEAVSLSSELHQVVSPFIPRVEALGGELLMTGEPIMSAEIARLIAKDSGLIGVTFLVMLIVVFVLTRSLLTIAVVLLYNIFVLVTTYGVMGWLGITLTPATSLVVFLLIPLSTAFVIHAVGYASREEGLTLSNSKLGYVIAALSTGLGFAATGLTPAHDIQMMALMGVIGIFATITGVFLLVIPLLASSTKLRLRINSLRITRALANPVLGYAFLACMLGYTLIGASKLEFNYGPVSNLPSENEIRKVYERSSETFPKMTIPLEIKTEDLSSVSQWESLSLLVDSLTTKYDGLTVHWLYPQIEQFSHAFTDTAKSNLSPDELAQYLLLFEPDELSLFVNPSHSAFVLYIQIPFDTSKQYLTLKKDVTAFLEREGLTGEFVGRVSKFFEAGHRVGVDTLKGLFLSSVLILAVLWFLYRSFPLALAGIAVNVIPVGAGLATLGFLAIPVEIGSAVVAAIAFGILLDDSMHLLVRVRDLVRRGYDPSTAVNSALIDLVKPITASTLTICIGYSVLFFADLNSFNDFALVISSTLILALLSDILVLPLLVRRFYRDPLMG